MTTNMVPAISVVMPAYHAARFIGDAIAGVLGQTYGDFELIVVDDGSTDATAAVVSNLAVRDARVRLIQQPNAGPSAARNTAIRHARASVIAYHDADDVSDPDRLEREYRYLEQNPDAAMVYSGYRVLQPDGRSRVYTAVPIGESTLLRSNIVACGTVMHRRSVLDAIGVWNEDIDWDLWLRISEHFRIGAIPAPLYTYRAHAGGVSKMRGWAANREIDIRMFERRYARRHEPIVQQKIRLLKWQLAVVAVAPEGPLRRLIQSATGLALRGIESVLFALARTPRL